MGSYTNYLESHTHHAMDAMSDVLNMVLLSGRNVECVCTYLQFLVHRPGRSVRNCKVPCISLAMTCELTAVLSAGRDLELLGPTSLLMTLEHWHGWNSFREEMFLPHSHKILYIQSCYMCE